jgi:hypothetical protein
MCKSVRCFCCVNEQLHTWLIWLMAYWYHVMIKQCLCVLYIQCIYIYIYIYIRLKKNIYGADVVEWHRALDRGLSDWCFSVSMVRGKIPSREEQKFDRYSFRRLPMTISYLMSRQREIHYSGSKMLLVKTYISPLFHKGIRKWK